MAFKTVDQNKKYEVTISGGKITFKQLSNSDIMNLDARKVEFGNTGDEEILYQAQSIICRNIVKVEGDVKAEDLIPTLPLGEQISLMKKMISYCMFATDEGKN